MCILVYIFLHAVSKLTQELKGIGSELKGAQASVKKVALQLTHCSRKDLTVSLKETALKLSLCMKNFTQLTTLVREAVSLQPVDRGAPPLQPVDRGAPPLQPVDRGAPPLQPVDRGAPPLQPVDRGAPPLQPVDRGAPPLQPVDRGAPPLQPVDRGAPPLQPVDRGAPPLQPVDRGAPPLQPVDRGAPSLQPVDRGAPSLQPVDRGAPPLQPVDRGAPPLQPVDRGAPPLQPPHHNIKRLSTLNTTNNVTSSQTCPQATSLVISAIPIASSTQTQQETPVSMATQSSLYLPNQQPVVQQGSSRGNLVVTPADLPQNSQLTSSDFSQIVPLEDLIKEKFLKPEYGCLSVVLMVS